MHPDHTKLAAASMTQSKFIIIKEKEIEPSQDSVNNAKQINKDV